VSFLTADEVDALLADTTIDCSGLQYRPTVDLTTLVRPGINTLEVTMRDLCGGAARAGGADRVVRQVGAAPEPAPKRRLARNPESAGSWTLTNPAATP
jgi:hypothetical protein